jgi:hypothetical protein
MKNSAGNPRAGALLPPDPTGQARAAGAPQPGATALHGRPGPEGRRNGSGAYCAVRNALVLAVICTAPWLKLGAQVPEATAELSLLRPSDTGISHPQTLRLGPDGLLWASFPAEGLFRVMSPTAGGAVERVLPTRPAPISRAPGLFGFSGGNIWTLPADSESIVWMSQQASLLRIQPVRQPDASDRLRALAARVVTPMGGLIWATRLLTPFPEGLRPDSIRELAEGIQGPGPIEQLPVWHATADGRLLAIPFTLAHSESRETAFLAPRAGEGETHGIRQGGRAPRAGFTVTSQPFRDNDLWAADPSGERFVVASRRVPESLSEASFRVTALTLRGDTVFHRTLPYEPVPIPRAVVDARVHAAATRLTPDSVAGVEAARRGLVLPPSYPPVTGLRIDSGGWVWVRREEADGAPDIRWTILDPQGNPQAHVSLPKDLIVGAVRRLEGWGFRADAEEGVSFWHVVAGVPR